MTNDIYLTAVQDFYRARQQAGLQQIMARWTGKSLDLLSYEEVRRQLQAHHTIERGLREIPLAAIVGSVGRYNDFTRTFLPKDDSDEERWARVKVAFMTQGLAPITVYQIGEVYFALDGNHRVSVARQLGLTAIEAYVTEVETNVPLTPDIEPNELILKAEYAQFLAQTRLNQLRPDVDLSLTSAGKYPLLHEHIEVHRYYMGIAQQQDIPYEEAVRHWCDEVYRPTVQLIREAGLLHEFPQRTEADLYVWLAEHRAEVETAVGWQVATGSAVAHLAQQFGNYKPAGVISQVMSVVGVPTGTPPETAVGRWRRERQSQPGEDPFIQAVLLPIHGRETDWAGFDQATTLVHRAGGRLFALHATADSQQKQSILTQSLQAEFERRCVAAGISGRFIAESGEWEELIYARERWADVTVLRPLAMTPLNNGDTQARLQRIVRHTSGPLLVVPGQTTPLDRPLLAYDLCPESDEALYIATYLAQQWHIPLTLLTVDTAAEATAQALARASAYLAQRGLTAAHLTIAGEDVVKNILDTVHTGGHNCLIIGSRRLSVRFRPVLGRTVSGLLAQSPVPLLICR